MKKEEEENINTTLIFWNVSSLPLSYYFIFNLLMRTIGTSLHKSQSRSLSKGLRFGVSGCWSRMSSHSMVINLVNKFVYIAIATCICV